MAARGYVTCRNTVATTGSMLMAIFKLNVGEPIPALNSLASYQDEDVLWTNAAMFTSSASSQVQHFDIHVKAHRRIDSNTIIMFIARAEGTDVLLTSVIRGLVNKAS